MTNINILTIPARTQGRVVISTPDSEGPLPLLVGFHGYGQSAEEMLESMLLIPGATRWRMASIQALHWFYERRTERVVASWMTRLGREQAIRDNRDYAASVMETLVRDVADRPVVYCGFSQGVAMAYRAAVSGPLRPAGVIILAGDLPPDVDPSLLPPVLIGRGTRDDWYTEAKSAADQARFSAARAVAQEIVFEGGHEWGEEFLKRAGDFLAGLAGF